MVELFEARKIAARIGLGLQYVLKEDRIFAIMKSLSPIILSEDLSKEVTVVAKGGTAINKVYFHGCQRFSEDLDFDAAFKKKLTKSEKIFFLNEHVISALRSEYEVDEGRLMRDTVRFTCTFMNEIGMKDCVFVEFNVEAKIFGEVDLREAKSEILNLSPVKIRIYSLPTLVAKKMVAFSDRFSGKDLYDIYYALKSGVDLKQVAESLNQILTSEHIEREEFITDLTKKLEDERRIERVHASSNPYIPRKLRANWTSVAKKVKEGIIQLHF